VTQRNQYVHEVVRDLYTLLLRLDAGDEIDIKVKRHQKGDRDDLLEWGSSKGTVSGCGNTAGRIADAYHNKKD